uniref:Uncharacterized protein n=1 Tax=Pseudo-nitzschia delicatissima TaxID=44447 RepID=A0A7S0T984_9STRA
MRLVDSMLLLSLHLLLLLLLLLLPGKTYGFAPLSPLVLEPTAKTRREPGILATTTTATTRTTRTTTTTTRTKALALGPDWIKNPDVWVFGAGVFPFAWATYEFWRRIMFGETFGTGTDSVIIGMEDSPSDSRGIRVLGRGALITAYCLFVIAFGTLGVVLYSVVTSEVPTEEAFAAAAAASEAVGDAL